MASNDGGPAFPTTEYYDEKPIGAQEGMSLRDYFAVHADQPGQLEMAAEAGVLLREHCGLPWNDPEAMKLPTWTDWFQKLPQPERYRLYATVRYRIADAMLAARTAGQE